jgi:hypothetical protein
MFYGRKLIGFVDIFEFSLTVVSSSYEIFAFIFFTLVSFFLSLFIIGFLASCLPFVPSIPYFCAILSSVLYSVSLSSGCYRYEYSA